MYIDATIRAQTRIAPFLLYLAVLLTALLLERTNDRTPKKKTPYVLYVTSLALLLATLIPQFGALNSMQQSNITGWGEKQIQYANILQKLDQHNLKAVAQYPSYAFPEGPIYKEFGNSDHFWPYLLDSAQDRHWSFGSTATQTTWQLLNTIASWPAENFYAGLRCLGYDALLVEKMALSTQQNIIFAGYINVLDKKQVLWNDRERMLVDLSQLPVEANVCNQISSIQQALR